MTTDVPARNTALPIVDDDGFAATLAASSSKGTSILDRRITLAELRHEGVSTCARVDLTRSASSSDADGTKLVDIRVGNGDWCGYIFRTTTVAPNVRRSSRASKASRIRR